MKTKLLLLVSLGLISCKAKVSPGYDPHVSCKEGQYLQMGEYGSVRCVDVFGEKGEKGDHGITGSDGITGTNGQDGYSVVVANVSASLTSCPHGGVTVLTATDLNRSGTLDPMEDSNIQSFDICNGAPGADGLPGSSAPTSPYAIDALIDPCGDHSGVYDEIILRLHNGTLLASFSDNVNGLNTRFSVLKSGSYKTTDGSSCFFSVDANGNIYNEHY